MKSLVHCHVESLELRQLLSLSLPIDSSSAASLNLAAGEHVVRVAYLIPSNRAPQADGVATIRTAMSWYQDWFRDQMDRNGFGPKTFGLETTSDGATPFVHVLDLPETDAYYLSDPWGRVPGGAMDLGLNLAVPGESWVLFFEGHVQFPDGYIEGGSRGGTGVGTAGVGGFAVLGSDMIALMKASLLTDDRPYAGLTIPALGRYPLPANAFIVDEGTTLSSVASSRVGAVAHELAHTFGLAHNYRNDENFRGNLLGHGLRGFRGNLYPDRYYRDWTRLQYADALAMSVNRFFNSGGSFADDVPPALQQPLAAQVENGSLKVSFAASDTSGLAAALLGDDRGIIGETKLIGTIASGSITVPYYAPGENNHLFLFLYDNAGNRSDYETTVLLPDVTNNAPIPFVRLSSETPMVGQSVLLDGSLTMDRNGGPMKFEWDLNGDGVFEVDAGSTSTWTTAFAAAGTRLIRLRVTDVGGAISLSSPIGIRVKPAAVTTASVTGSVFDDKNGNGVREPGEGVLAGAVVYIDANNNGIVDPNDKHATVTDAAGNYALTSLPPGSHRVRYDAVAGRRITTPAQGYFDVTLAAGATATAHFGSTTIVPKFVLGTTPLTMQAEDFDTGGDGVAYHDVDALNRGGAYRATGVDIQPTTDSSGGFNVGWAKAGEWLAYTVNVQTSGYYVADFRVASNGAGGAFHLEFDGSDVTGPLTVPNTLGWQNWTTVSKKGAYLGAGTHVLRLVMDSNGATGWVGNFNHLKIRRDVVAVNAAAAHVRDGSYRFTNYGSSPALEVKKSTTNFNRETYLTFDLASVATVSSAKLRLYGGLLDASTPSIQIGVFSALASNWTESGLTWLNKPASGLTAVGTVTVSGTTKKWYEIDLTNFLEVEKAAGRNVVTLVLRSNTFTSTLCSFNSDEAAVNRPQFLIAQ